MLIHLSPSRPAFFARSTRAARPAFTLIELLVVISIIALLVAILLPSLQKARTRAQLISAVSSTRQIMQALHAYGTDNRESLPWVSMDPLDDQFGNPDWTLSANNSEMIWSGKLYFQKYVNNLRLFWSPKHFYGGLTQIRYTGFGASHWGAMPPIAWGGSKYSGGSHCPYRGLLNTPLRLDGYRAIGVNPNPGTNVRDPSAFKPAKTLVIVDTSFDWFWSSPASYGQRSGSLGIFPQMNATSLMSYDNAVATGYLDGHAVGEPGENIGWRPITERTGTWIWWNQSNEAHRAPWFLRYRTDLDLQN